MTEETMALVERFSREMQPLLRGNDGLHGAVHLCGDSEEAAEGILRLASELPLNRLVMAARRELDPVARALAAAAQEGGFHFERDREESRPDTHGHAKIGIADDQGEKSRGIRDPHEYAKFDGGIGGADVLIAESATIGLVAGPQEARALSLLPSTHIVVAPVSRVVERIHEALARLMPPSAAERHTAHSAQAEGQLVHPTQAEGHSVISTGEGAGPSPTITFITGPSRTADIEKVLVLPAHGPSRLYIWLVEDR